MSINENFFASSSTPEKPLPVSLTTINTPASSRVQARYGDSDLGSKRRKYSGDHLFDYESFKEVFYDTACSDFKCDVLNDNSSASTPKETNYKSNNNPAFISTAPSETSFGFENTFDILQDQISRARDRHKKYFNRISEEYCPSFSSFIQDTISLCTPTYDDTKPLTFFELQYEAAERLKEKRAKINVSVARTTPPSDIATSKRLNRNEQPILEDKDKIKDQIETPLNKLLYDFHTLGLGITTEEENVVDISDKSAASSEKVVNESGDYPECVYHVRKGNDGKLYLRVVNNLSVDEVLCGNRISQMTRAYDDIEAVTRLLEEKEKDLELTVQIGKELLTQNARLEKRIVDLEAELKKSNEERSQLTHELHQKSELIAVLTNDIDEGQENETPTSSKSINLELLQRKIASLQDENRLLKREAYQLAKQTDEVEEQERKLMEDITSQLNSTNNQFDGLNMELERQKEENRLQYEEILHLQARLVEIEMRLHQLTTENDEQGSILCITKENQNMLAAELAEFKQRYEEVLALLQETQEQLRMLKKKSQPQVRSSFLTALAAPQPDSLHSELMETSLYSDNSLDSGISADRLSNPQPFKKVFETVRFAAKNGHYSDGMSHLGVISLSSSTQPKMCAMPYMPPSVNVAAGNVHRHSSLYSNSTYPSFDSSSLGMKTLSRESLTSTQSDDGYPSQPAGMPGAPGAKDLEAALKRLTPAEVLVRRTMLAHAPAGTYTYDEIPQHAPQGFRTPESIMSTGSSATSSGLAHGQTSQWRLPERLQIVKPMEGSQTLHHWSRLAQPNLSGLLEERPGVTVRGGRGLEELGMQMYTLSDIEEDIDDNPGKQFQPSGCIYTYTNSTVMHPDDGTAALLGLSIASSCVASNSTSRQSTCPPTPPSGMSRRNSCSTYSVNMGLASLLNERGIKAITPSALNTPAGPNYSPTVTPCNSPEGSPTRSLSPEPLFGLLSSGADLIRRKLLGEVERPQRSPPKQQKIMLSRLEKRALRSLRLLEKVESVGLENIIGSQPNAVSHLSSGIASRSVSPMAQLTSLKNLSSSSTSLGMSCLHRGISNDSMKSFVDSDLPSSLQSTDIDSDDSTHPVPSTSRNNGSNSMAVPPSTTRKIPYSVDTRVKQMQRQKSRRNLKNGIGGKRHDLGTVGGRLRPDLGRVDNNANMKQCGTDSRSAQQQQKQSIEDNLSTQSMTQSFVGSISSLFFGRKGGWL